jgi:hypothetical protein
VSGTTKSPDIPETPFFISNIGTDYMEKMIREFFLPGRNLWAGYFLAKGLSISGYAKMNKD